MSKKEILQVNLSTITSKSHPVIRHHEKNWMGHNPDVTLENNL